MADEIAKIEGYEVTAGFVNNKSPDVNSNNNKLQVRNAEKVAKFVKKVALKSPKKTGVKKRNYYNTKLTFSQDPKNPNVLAAATATATATATAAGVSGDVSGEDDVSAVDDIADRADYNVVSGDDEIDNVEEGSAEDPSAFPDSARPDSDQYENEDIDSMTAELYGGDVMEDVELEVEVVDIFSGEISPVSELDKPPSMVPVSVITAIDLITFSTQLSL